MEDDILLYKYMSFNRFIDMIELKRLYLTNITVWEDPYEGFPIIRNFGDGKPSWVVNMMGKDLVRGIQNSTLKSIYAQSWTYQDEESDAMWRIYSQDKLGVRIAVNLVDIICQVKKAISKIYKDIVLNHYKVKYRQEFDVKKCIIDDG